ncbi:hypothetical protein HaLaN_02952 [Haematococcus lacustris]|uniref:Uncharacterized protein n=1 Tax=Haematococcus lacustris TaxID=44745 RepID=A0A699YYA8_HAELA|nr:hypothetical protein HaLaN_02952 [Haematococcus lacustris]
MAPASWQQVAVAVSWTAFSGASILINKYIMGLRTVCIDEASPALCGRLPPVALFDLSYGPDQCYGLERV